MFMTKMIDDLSIYNFEIGSIRRSENEKDGLLYVSKLETFFTIYFPSTPQGSATL